MLKIMSIVISNILPVMISIYQGKMDNWSNEPAVTLFERFSNLPHHPTPFKFNSRPVREYMGHVYEHVCV